MAGAGLVLAVALTLAPAAQAKALSGTITDVTATATATGTVTTDFDFCVPNGAKAGDTFSLTIPGQLAGYPPSFDLSDPAVNAVVATVAVVNNVATFTLTSYVNNHLNVCGLGMFTANFSGSSQVGVNTLTYTTNDGKVFSSTVTHSPTPTINRAAPFKSGRFTNSQDQCRTDGTACVAWTVQSELGPLTSGTLTDTLTASGSETLDCPSSPVFQVGTPASTTNDSLKNVSTYTGTVSWTCSQTGFTWTFGAVPAGEVVQVVLDADAPANPAGNVSFTNYVVGVSNVHADPAKSGAGVRSASAGGQAAGDLVTITKWATLTGPAKGLEPTAPGLQLQPGTDLPITMTITNSGSTPLKNLTVSDHTTAGPALTGLSCNFASSGAAGAPTSGTTWAGPLASGVSFTCTGTIPSLNDKVQETDAATVTAAGNGPVTSSSTFNAIGSGALEDSTTPAPPSSSAPSSTGPSSSAASSSSSSASSGASSSTPASNDITPVTRPGSSFPADSSSSSGIEAVNTNASDAGDTGNLASTGVETTLLIGVAAALLIGGGVILRTGRRRRTH